MAKGNNIIGVSSGEIEHASSRKLASSRTMMVRAMKVSRPAYGPIAVVTLNRRDSLEALESVFSGPAFFTEASASERSFKKLSSLFPGLLVSISGEEPFFRFFADAESLVARNTLPHLHLKLLPIEELFIE